jgi:hypothetical protein
LFGELFVGLGCGGCWCLSKSIDVHCTSSYITSSSKLSTFLCGIFAGEVLSPYQADFRWLQYQHDRFSSLSRHRPLEINHTRGENVDGSKELTVRESSISSKPLSVSGSVAMFPHNKAILSLLTAYSHTTHQLFIHIHIHLHLHPHTSTCIVLCRYHECDDTAKRAITHKSAPYPQTEGALEFADTPQVGT